MQFKGYEIEQKGERIIVEGVKEFEPMHIFECGQCFRWKRMPDKSYTGVAYGRVVNTNYAEGKLEIYNTNTEEFKNLWFDYFDLGRDYSHIKKSITKDKIMKKVVAFGYGIRLLRQEIWESLISFIISANNRIPMIVKTVNEISRLYGHEIYLDSEKYYSFPKYDAILQGTIEQLKSCKAGFRCRYIRDTAKAVAEGEIELSAIDSMSTKEAREYLMKLPGVGPKVADCTLLYSGKKYDVFPTDVWVKRAMEELYFGRETTFKEIQDFIIDYFGEYAGFAQQYLFYYARENKIGAR
ncbi:MAG: DNA-3-methyladenine glycosylase 2 family protein [Clostridium sp.]|mgnify:CR=1 FL=1|nr:DNA-3-methyladenine glycosylase 2 family protein [Clostridium sp.]